MTKPERQRLSHPATTPRLTKTGAQVRDRPIFSESGGEGLTQWEVEVTPLRGATNVGRGVDSGRQKPRALFEIRAAYYGKGLPEFGSQPNTRLVPHTHTEDQELAMAIARRFAELLRGGYRDFDFMRVAEDVGRSRG